MDNFDKIRIRRGSNNNLLEERVAKGQPIFNKTRNYLTINPTSNNNELYKNIKPIDVRRIMGYHTEHTQMQSSVSEVEKYLIEGLADKLSILSNKKILLNSNNYIEVNIDGTAATEVDRFMQLQVGSGKIKLNNTIEIIPSESKITTTSGSLQINPFSTLDIQKQINFNDNLNIANGKGFISNILIGTEASPKNLEVNGVSEFKGSITGRNGLSILSGDTTVQKITSQALATLHSLTVINNSSFNTLTTTGTATIGNTLTASNNIIVKGENGNTILQTGGANNKVYITGDLDITGNIIL